MTGHEPDLTDPLVWDLLQRNHVPEEQTIKRTDGAYARNTIVCEQDGMTWPCPTKLRLDATDQPSRIRSRRGEPPVPEADLSWLKSERS